ncbi:MAG: hypothetical protein AAF997_24925 [Myxococcota bacterium]
MKNGRASLTGALLLMILGCGDADGSGTGSGTPPSATSELCEDVRGLEAVYYDFINGVPRGDLPATAFTIPFDIDLAQSPYSNPTSLLLGFTVPVGWTVSDGDDVSGFAIPGTVAAANLVRDDEQAVWRYILNAQVTGDFTSAAILGSEIAVARDFIGNPEETQVVCEANAQRPGILGLESAAAQLLRAGDFTIFARAQVINVSGVGSYYSGYLSVAPTTESERVTTDIFVPMITQLFGGGSDPPECGDGDDNDGDGDADFPADDQCTSPSDDDEST